MENSNKCEFVLVSNDDGWICHGLRELAWFLQDMANELCVIE